MCLASPPRPRPGARPPPPLPRGVVPPPPFARLLGLDQAAVRQLVDPGDLLVVQAPRPLRRVGADEALHVHVHVVVHGHPDVPTGPDERGILQHHAAQVETLLREIRESIGGPRPAAAPPAFELIEEK